MWVILGVIIGALVGFWVGREDGYMKRMEEEIEEGWGRIFARAGVEDPCARDDCAKK